MKSYELQPTPENFIDTLCNDSLGRNEDLFYFLSILNNLDYGCSISLDGGWGSGKTFFVNHAKMILDARNNLISKTSDSDKERILKVWNTINKDSQSEWINQVCVYYDAWANDDDEEPVLSLVHSIIESGKSSFYFKPDANGSKIIESIITDLTNAFTGNIFSKTLESFKVEDPLAKVKTKKDVNSLISGFFSSLLPERGDRLVVFIDELDRCNPSFAVRLLERIKHYFTCDRVTFVFSVNTNELQHTIRQHYGAQFDAVRYLSRFFSLRLSLPRVNLSKYYALMAINSSSIMYDVVCDAVIRNFNFEMREISQYMQITRTAAYNISHGTYKISPLAIFREGLEFGIHLFVPVILGLQFHGQSMYNNFINGSDSSFLLDICKPIDPGYFDILLDEGEGFKQEIRGKQVFGVEKEDKLNALYNAIFNRKTFPVENAIRLGKVAFPIDIKEELVRISGLLSRHMSLD